MKVFVETNTTNPYVDHLLIDCVELALGESATWRVLYENIDNEQLNVKYIQMKDAAYSNWGLDDDYVIDYVLFQLGFIKAQEST